MFHFQKVTSLGTGLRADSPGPKLERSSAGEIQATHDFTTAATRVPLIRQQEKLRLGLHDDIFTPTVALDGTAEDFTSTATGALKKYILQPTASRALKATMTDRIAM